MSIVNLWRDDNGILVVVDTNGRTPEGRFGADFSKLVMVPHTRCLLAARGERVLFALFVAQVMASPEFIGSYDQMVPLVPEMMARMESDEHDEAMILELYVMGWSDELQRMAARVFKQSPGSELEITDIGTASGYGAPIDEGDMEEEIFSIPFKAVDNQSLKTDILAAVTKQVAWGRKEYPDVAFGGRIFLGRIDRQGMSLDEIGEIP